MVHHCCVVGCSSKSDREVYLRFHRFPADKARRAKWIAAVRRQDWHPTSHTKYGSSSSLRLRHLSLLRYLFFATGGRDLKYSLRYSHNYASAVLHVHLPSLASQPHSVPQRRSLSVSARGGRVWRLRTTFRGSLREFE